MRNRIGHAVIVIMLAGLSGFGQQRTLGMLSANPYAPNSIANPYGLYGSQYSPRSINNPYGIYASPYSATSVNNPYATNPPRIFSRDGKYLGKLSANPYDPESTSNPYGKYGSPYSPTSINNPYGTYGSPYSPMSPNNPYSMDGPTIIAPSHVLGLSQEDDDPE